MTDYEEKPLDMLNQLPQRITFRQWVFQIVMVGIKEGMAQETISECIKVYAKEKGYSRYQVYRELKRIGMISLKDYRNPKLVECDRCSCLGNLHFYYDGPTPKYYVQHEHIGSWINTKAPKYRRCYQKPERYEYLNSQIKFYEQRLKEDEEEALQDMRTELLKMSELYATMKAQGLL